MINIFRLEGTVGMQLWIFFLVRFVYTLASGTFDLQLDLTDKQIKDLQWITKNILARNNFVKFKKTIKIINSRDGFPIS